MSTLDALAFLILLISISLIAGAAVFLAASVFSPLYAGVVTAFSVAFVLGIAFVTKMWRL